MMYDFYYEDTEEVLEYYQITHSFMSGSIATMNQGQDSLSLDRLNQFNNAVANPSPKQKIREKIYDLDWIDQIPSKYFPQKLKDFIKENLICQICLKLMEQVVELQCQHLCCSSCLKIMQKNGQLVQSKCPFCKQVIQPILNKSSLRQQMLQFYIKQLQFPCFMCHELTIKQKVTKEESKDQNLPNIWYGSVEDLENHFGHHEQDKSGERQDVADQFKQYKSCQNDSFGCQKIFDNDMKKSMHEGVNCGYRWIRCNKCIKIYFAQDYKKHNCKPDEFYNCSELFPKYNLKNKSIKNEPYLVTIICQIDYFLQQMNRYFLFDLEKHDKNIVKVESTFMYMNMIDALNSEILKSMVTGTKKESIETYIKPFEFMTKVNIPKEYQKSSIFISCLVANSKLDAIQILGLILKQYGAIKSIKIFGVGKTGKYYGVVDFEEKESARCILRNGYSFNTGINSFNVSVNKK